MDRGRPCELRSGCGSGPTGPRTIRCRSRSERLDKESQLGPEPQRCHPGISLFGRPHPLDRFVGADLQCRSHDPVWPGFLAHSWRDDIGWVGSLLVGRLARRRVCGYVGMWVFWWVVGGWVGGRAGGRVGGRGAGLTGGASQSVVCSPGLAFAGHTVLSASARRLGGILPAALCYPCLNRLCSGSFQIQFVALQQRWSPSPQDTNTAAGMLNRVLA